MRKDETGQDVKLLFFVRSKYDMQKIFNGDNESLTSKATLLVNDSQNEE